MLDEWSRIHQVATRLEKPVLKLREICAAERAELKLFTGSGLTEDDRDSIEGYFISKFRQTQAHGLRRYAPGQKIHFYGGSDRKWYVSSVLSVDSSLWSAKHKIIDEFGSGADVELTPFNHAPSLMPVVEFDAFARSYVHSIRESSLRTTDALSGEMLDVLKDCVVMNVSLQSPASAAPLVTSHPLVDASDVNGLCEWFYTTHILRVDSSRTESVTAACVILTAPPAAGKTCAMLQLFVRTLDRGLAALDQNGSMELIPILIRVSDLQSRLLSEDPGSKDAFQSKWNWIDAYLSLVYGGSSDTYRMLRQAMMARRVVILLDGIDEAGQAREQLDSHILNVLAGQGFIMIVTSRPSGTQTERYSASGFQELKLSALSTEQQRSVIARRISEPESAEQLTRYVEDKVPNDARSGEKITGNPLMLSMVISIFRSSVSEDGEISMPENVSELYGIATSSMLKTIDSMNGAKQIHLILQGTFYQAHVAKTRTITEEHLWKAAINACKAIKSKSEWIEVEEVRAACATAFHMQT